MRPLPIDRWEVLSLTTAFSQGYFFLSAAIGKSSVWAPGLTSMARKGVSWELLYAGGTRDTLGADLAPRGAACGLPSASNIPGRGSVVRSRMQTRCIPTT